MGKKRKHKEPSGKSARRQNALWQKIQIPLFIYLAFAVFYSFFMWDRMWTVSTDNHFVYLAESFLNGRLDMVTKPPHLNDWAKYDGRWFVSFPPFPAVLMMPGVAVWGMKFLDRFFAFLFAPLGPALFFVLLNRLRSMGRFDRKTWEIIALTAVYGVGTVYFFAAVQGTTWYVAHMIGGVLLTLYMLASLDARHPVLAGAALGCAFATRTPMIFAFPFILYEAVRASSTAEAGAGLFSVIRKMDILKTFKKLLLFAIPVAVVIILIMLMNYARYDDVFEFGHRHLVVRWAPRIEKWGLFNYHFLSRNLMVAGALLPWIIPQEPYIQISTHGLAVWFTTPLFLYVLWPKKMDSFYQALIWSVVLVAIPSLFYQNSGWVQFGYRFSLDYTQFLLIMIALGGRRFGKVFHALAAWCLIVNLFGAVTFDRMKQYYPMNSTHSYYQPD